MMKEALDREGLKPHLMIQPVGYHDPDAGPLGAPSLPEAPFGKPTASCNSSALITFSVN